MNELLSTQQAAELLGVTKGTFGNSLSTWGLRRVKRTRASAFYLAADVERVKATRDAAATQRSARRSAKTPKAATAKARTSKLQTDNDSLTSGEMAVIYDAWLKTRLGSGSPWRHRTPPAAYKLAWESREAARADAAEWELAA